MIKPCIICDKPVIVIGCPEIVVCSNDYCIKVVEDHISIHYQSENVVLSKNHVHRNDFQSDMMGVLRRSEL